MEVTLLSGKKMVITEASFSAASELKMAILEAIKGFQMPASLVEAEASLGAILSRPDGMQAIGNVLINLATSKRVEAAVFECGKKALYEGRPVSTELFDDPALGATAREDYFEIVGIIVKENVGRFFKRALSGLLASVGMKPATQQ